ncbi:5-formyltetrahydrofolate cyclo-ligase [Bradyrhizobium sp. Ash2021]|uniref:5-formyltetrahydrofolate cyclo-ligase n=1 Tax=Bradyrhizobium sp. Ash2021 TaxID=2954771 RepID=UPI002815A619|nr:5-formyltetrahydrofolate cyclo-ligase [Bradyrhizobium sp. Ash2021]WMT72066.1 5-formyltetrahydrofolate cyclo-ligase [Bradyrhizobium sp. Ash2021]
MIDEDDDTSGSSACITHEVDPAHSGLSLADGVPKHSDVLRWRKAERARLIKERLEMSTSTRKSYSDLIAELLDVAIGDLSGRVVSGYWPFRGEPDLRGWLERLESRGGRCALPVVIETKAPLVFRIWGRGEKLERGVWDIPVPAAGKEVSPDVMIAPIVGYDRDAYRLGYGGGYFDRTLAATPKRPLIIGVGYSQAAMPTIYPELHDIPMDKIVTERGIFIRAAKSGESARNSHDTNGGSYL